MPSKEEMTIWTTIHVGLTFIIKNTELTFMGTCAFSQYGKMSDKRITSLYIALMTSLAHMTELVNKLHIYWIIENYGIFVPQAILSLIGLVTLFYYKESYLGLNELKKSDWAVSDKFF